MIFTVKVLTRFITISAVQEAYPVLSEDLFWTQTALISPLSAVSRPMAAAATLNYYCPQATTNFLPNIASINNQFQTPEENFYSAFQEASLPGQIPALSPDLPINSQTDLEAEDFKVRELCNI